jgi:hypothetical protein
MENHQQDLKPAMLRTLQQAAGAPGSEKVVSVATSSELQAALRKGARHIEITEHLDFTNEEAAFEDYGEAYKLSVSRSTWSIRVRRPCASLAMSVDEYTGSSHIAPLKGTVSTPERGSSACSPALPFLSQH